MHSDDHLVLRKIYDTSDAKVQWRCHLRILRGPQNLLVVLGISTILAVIGGLPPIFILLYMLLITAITVVQISFVVKKRTAKPRTCITAISKDWLRDTTPDSEREYSWEQIKRVSNYDGDIVFETQKGVVFIPESAFVDEESRSNFYMQAKQFWQAGRVLGNGNKSLPSSSNKTIAPIREMPPTEIGATVEDLLAEDESAWVALEAEHKKQLASGKESADDKKSGLGGN